MSCSPVKNTGWDSLRDAPAAPYIGVMGQFKFMVSNLTHVLMHVFATLNILPKKHLGSFVFGANWDKAKTVVTSQSLWCATQ